MSPCVVCVGVRDCNKKHMEKALKISGEVRIPGRHVQNEKKYDVGKSHGVLNMIHLL